MSDKHPKTSVSAHNSVKVIPAPSYLVNYTDGNGKAETKLAFILGDEVRFLADGGGLSKPMQEWLKNDILVALGMRDAGEKSDESKAVHHTPMEADLESQV